MQYVRTMYKRYPHSREIKQSCDKPKTIYKSELRKSKKLFKKTNFMLKQIEKILVNFKQNLKCPE